MAETRRCSKCGKDLPVWAFRKRPDSADGYRRDCKKCHTATCRDGLRRRRFFEGRRDVGAVAKGTLSVAPINVSTPRPSPVRSAEKKAGRDGEPAVHLLTADEHIPHTVWAKAHAITRYAADTRLDGRHFLGDVVENAAVSKWLDGNVRKQFDATAWPEQMEQANRYLDGAVGAARRVNPGCRVTLLQGNHEAWAEWYRDRYPMLGDLLDVPLALRLAKRRVEYFRFWTHNEAVEIGDLLLTHGRFTSIYHARRHLLKYKRSMLYGHCHDTQRAVEPRWGGSGRPLVAQCIGTLRDLKVDFQCNEDNNWEHAFAVVWSWPDGSFIHQVVPVTEKGFVGPTNGRLYRLT